MDNQQKDIILKLLKNDEFNKIYNKKYWFSYQDFLDPADPFTAFSCENLEGKQGYIDLIENLLRADESAKIFVEVYGYEKGNNEQFIKPSIYADTLIIFSRLSFPEIEQIFNEPEDIFPSDIGEETDLQQIILVSSSGNLIPGAELSKDDYSIYYCWWD